MKEVDPDAWAIMQRYGGGTLRAQARGLGKLGDMAPEFAFDGTQLITRDVGKFGGTRFSAEYWKTWWQASKRLGPIDFINDIQPRNMGAGGLIFDPVLHPLDQTVAWAFSIGAGTAGGIYIADKVEGDK